MKKPEIFFYLIMVLSALLFQTTCNLDENKDGPEFSEAARILRSWNKFLLELERNTPGYRPPVSGRMFAYCEMAAYEASLPAMKDHVSMAKYCPEFQPAVAPAQDFHLAPAINAAFAVIARDFFPTAPEYLLTAIDKLESENLELIHRQHPELSLQASVDFGKQTARAVWQYSVSDSIGHDGFMYNFDRNFQCMPLPGKWQPDKERPMPPLLPYWGKSRAFVAGPANLNFVSPPDYSEATGSTSYSQALEVYSISQSLSSEDHWIVDFWSDDIPGFTITPASRWISITNQAIDKADPGFVKSMEIYLKTGIALCDAGISCWAEKYQYQTARPQTYINKLIQPDWAPLHKNPSFPSYPSGHACFGAAVATILTAYLGDDFELTDRTHDGRKEFPGRFRQYRSFKEMAQENAYSRLLNGVHFRMDCEEGMRLGSEIGNKILALPLVKDKVASLEKH